MKKTRFTEAQIMGVLRRMEGGVPAAELCREHGMSSATLYKWRAKYGGMDASLITDLRRARDILRSAIFPRRRHNGDRSSCRCPYSENARRAKASFIQSRPPKATRAR